MTNSYLVDIIKTLSAEDREELLHALHSPSNMKELNAHEVQRLFQVICAAAPAFSEEQLNKKTVFEHIFPGQMEVKGKLEKIMSGLNIKVRKYLLAKQYLTQSQEAQLQADWVGWLTKQGFSERARQTLLQLQNQLHQHPFESLHTLKAKMGANERQHMMGIVQNQFVGDLSIPALMQSLDLYYFTYRLELENKYLLLQKVTNLPDIAHNTSGYLPYLSLSSLLLVSHKVNTFLSKPMPLAADFEELLEAFHHYEEAFPYDVRSGFAVYLRNLCTLLINDGHLEYITVLHSINKDNLKKGYLLDDGKVPPSAFLNIIEIAIRAKDYHWAMECTEKYKKHVVGGDPEHFYYKMNKSHCLFALGDYQGALDTMPEVPSNNHYHHMIRRLELKAYYEMKSDLLLYKLDAFRKYIERTASKSLSPELQEMDSNFIYILLTLAQSPIKDKAKSAVLTKRIEGKKRIAERSWLMEKAKALA